jgi:hypothetical protein
MELNETHLLHVFVDYVNTFGQNMNVINKNT